LNLKATSFTGKRKLPSVDDDALETLTRKNPKVTALSDRIKISKGTRRLGTELAVDPDTSGRVHFVYSLHRTNTGRLASGSDDVDADKLRVSPGNAQNKAERDRTMYAAPPGFLFLQADYSQVESRVVAWHAKDMELLEAWDAGRDVYAEIAAKLYRINASEARTHKIMFMGSERSARDGGKRAHLALCYYMQPTTMASTFGIDIGEAFRLSEEWKQSRRATVKWQQDQIKRAASFDGLRNSFGRKLTFPKKSTEVGWVVADPAAAVAAVPQSDVGDMCKVMLPYLDAVPSAELVTTTHDSFGFYVRDDPMTVKLVSQNVRVAMERAWTEFGVRSIRGKPTRFRVPVEVGVGRNWGKFDSVQNLYGLKPLEEESGCQLTFVPR
jgi:DNA polymerase-1